MKFYIEGTTKWVKISIRKWDGRRYGEDFSNEILIDFKDSAVYSEEEIFAVLEWCAEYCDEYDCQLLVEEGDDDKF